MPAPTEKLLAANRGEIAIRIFRAATELVRARRPNLAIDGEVQADVAIAVHVGRREIYRDKDGSPL